MWGVVGGEGGERRGGGGVVFFFFSSRRRHTRFTSDWSSDVCSSDLRAGVKEGFDYRKTLSIFGTYRKSRKVYITQSNLRSEERRVGKECRSRWSPYH